MSEARAPSWEAYRRQRRALEAAAAGAAGGHLANVDFGTIDAVLASQGLGGAFADGAALAVAAQSEWWHRLFGRIDCDLDDDLTGASAAESLEVVQRAWAANQRDMAGYLILAWSAAHHPAVRRDGRRYARLLALLAGQASPHDLPSKAMATGLALVDDLTRAGAAARPWSRAGQLRGSLPHRKDRASRLSGRPHRSALDPVA
jgi:hypothetical protein